MATNFLSSFTGKMGLPTRSVGLLGLLGKKAPVAPLGAPAVAGASIGPTSAPKPSVGESSPQIAAIQASLGGLKTQAEGIQRGLQNVQQRESIGNRLDPFRKKVSGLYGPSSEEDQVRSKLANLLSARDQGLVQAEEQAVPLQAIIGEQGRIEKRALANSIPLQEQLSQLQARREGERQAAEFEYGAEKDVMSQQREEEKFQQPDEEKLDEYTNEAGKRVIVMRNKKTGAIREEEFGGVQSKPSESSQLRAAKASGIARARPLITAAKGQGNLADTYLDLRAQYAEAFGDARDFDQVFASFLDEADRKRLLGGAGTVKADSGGLGFDDL